MNNTIPDPHSFPYNKHLSIAVTHRRYLGWDYIMHPVRSISFWCTRRVDSFLGFFWKPVEIQTWVSPRRREKQPTMPFMDLHPHGFHVYLAHFFSLTYPLCSWSQSITYNIYLIVLFLMVTHFLGSCSSIPFSTIQSLSWSMLHAKDFTHKNIF